jgi:hypothetical protein
VKFNKIRFADDSGLMGLSVRYKVRSDHPQQTADKNNSRFRFSARYGSADTAAIRTCDKHTSVMSERCADRTGHSAAESEECLT